MKNILFSVLIFSLISCDFIVTKKHTGNNVALSQKDSLLAADKAFSEMCVKDGYKQACLEFIDSNGVLLRPNAMPIMGADAVDYISMSNDTGFVMKWEPRQAVVAASGDMGYTFGVYAIEPKGADTTILGNYVNIWRRQSDGKWKFALNSANDGLGDSQE